MKQLLETGFTSLGLSAPPEAAGQLLTFCDLLLEQNKRMNLTRVTEPEQVMTLHFLDSAVLAARFDLTDQSVIDVGTGAGFPGLVLKLLVPSIRLTLLDSLGKRVQWLASVCRTLGLYDVTCLHARAEEQALEPNFRDSFDFAVSRAVASLPQLTELCLPYVKPGGAFLAMKSVNCDEELSQAMSAIRTLGGGSPSLTDDTIPHTDIVHRIVRIPKLTPTPKGYPRRWAKIQKASL